MGIEKSSIPLLYSGKRKKKKKEKSSRWHDYVLHSKALGREIESRYGNDTAIEQKGWEGGLESRPRRIPKPVEP